MSRQDGQVQQDAAKLERRLPEVFPAVPLAPGRSPVEWDRELDRNDAEKLRETLRGKAWTDLSSKWLARGGWASFCNLSPDGYRSYVPALLREALRAVDDTRGVLHSVVFSLQPSWWRIYYRGADQQHESRVAGLEPAQFDMICEFLALAFRAGHPFLSAEALRWGWSTRDTTHHACMHEHYARMYGHHWPAHPDSGVAGIISQIVEAFTQGACPPDDQLSGSDQGDEPAGYALEFRGQDWRTLHPDFLANNYAALGFLTSEGFRYFLPAFLLADLHGGDSNADPVFHLTSVAECGSSLEAYNRERKGGFVLVQCEAIVAYLRYQAAQDRLDREAIERALDRYWLPRLAAGGLGP